MGQALAAPSYEPYSYVFKNKNYLSEAANLLLPFLNSKLHDIHYKLLLAQSNFYTNFPMSHKLMTELIKEYPHRSDFLIENIAYEVRHKNYKNAIYQFEKIKPSREKYPNIHFYYAYALLFTKREAEGLKILTDMVTSKQEFIEKYNAVSLVEKLKTP